MKSSIEGGGDIYLASTRTHSPNYVWKINSGASFHMTRHKDWYCEYEKYNGGDVFLGDDLVDKSYDMEGSIYFSNMKGL
jgi:hypothetical protein